MGSDLFRRIRSLFGSKDESSIELVMAGNAVAAIALVGFGWLKLGLTPPWIAVLLPTVFVFLTACLLSRYTVWLAAVLGSLGIAALPAALLAAAMDPLPYGRWIGGGLGTVAGLAIGFWTYSRVSRIAR